MDWRNYIVRDPNILFGKPTVKGTRISVEVIINFLAAGWTREELFDSYPNLTPESLQACLLYVADLLEKETGKLLAPREQEVA